MFAGAFLKTRQVQPSIQGKVMCLSDAVIYSVDLAPAYFESAVSRLCQGWEAVQCYGYKAVFLSDIVKGSISAKLENGGGVLCSVFVVIFLLNIE